MNITLDGQRYELKAGGVITRTPLMEWPENTRFDGQQQRKDRRWLSSWNISNWAGGLGIERQNVALPAHSNRLWDVENVDTRWSFGIPLSPALNTCTVNPSRSDLDLELPYLDQLYFCETNYQGTTWNQPVSIAYKFTPPFTLGSFLQVAQSQASTSGDIRGIGSLFSVRAFGTKIAFTARESNRSNDAFFTVPIMGVGVGSGVGAGGLGFPSGNAGAPNPQIGDMGGTLYLTYYHSGTNKMHFYLSDTGIGTLHSVGTIDTVIGSYLAPLETDGVKMYACLPQGIYNFDDTPSVIIDTSRSQEKQPRQVMFENYLYFKNKYALMKYDGTDVTSEGYDKDDGLPSDKWGEITAMTSSYKYIFAAVKGATYSHILARDTDSNWQYYARIPTAGVWVKRLFLSNANDGIDRLWCIFGSYGYPGYFLNPMVNPLQAGTYSYVPTGHFTPPIYDGGMSEENGAFYDMSITADAVGSNYITTYYGLNGASPITTLGVVATTPQTFKYGSPYGLEGYRIQPKFILSRADTAGTTPVFREATIHYLKDPNKRETFDFTVDLDETANIERKSAEAIVGSLDYVRDKKTLVPFWYGQIATKNVKILDIPSEEEVEGGKIYEGEREGFIRLRVATIL